jgi:hypothetical protein
MKPLVKKILEAGLVNKHVAKMMERWGSLEPDSVDLVGQMKVTEETLQEFAGDIEELVESGLEDGKKETRLEVTVTKPPAELFCPSSGTFSAAEDVMGKYVVSPKVVLHPGDHIWPDGTPSTDPPWTVLEVEPLHQGDKLVAYQVTVEKPE